MSDRGQRERAEAAFGHLQNAATEMIAAAHDALDIVAQAVSNADLGDILSAFKRSPPAGETAPPPPPAAPHRPRHRGPVQRISVR